LYFWNRGEKGGEIWERGGRDSAENKMAHPYFFFYVSKKNWTRISNLDMTINAKARRDNQFIIFIYFIY
jgi:hypothetical protein